MQMNNPENCNVAAVIGNTVKFYGKSSNGFRPYLSQEQFSNPGKAKEAAEAYDTKQRTFNK